MREKYKRATKNREALEQVNIQLLIAFIKTKGMWEIPITPPWVDPEHGMWPPISIHRVQPNIPSIWCEDIMHLISRNLAQDTTHFAGCWIPAGWSWGWQENAMLLKPWLKFRMIKHR